MVTEMDELNKKIEEHEKRIEALEEELETLAKRKKINVNKKVISIKEFILSKNPKNDVQKTLAIGYYLEKYGNIQCYNLNDIKQGFKDAREKLPKNVGDKIQLNIRKGHMTECKNKKDKLKTFVSTATGEKYVENNFMIE